MKKRVLCIALAFIMLFGLSMSAFASKSDVSILIDNKEVEFNATSGEPFVDANGRTQVPLRVVMEQYGCKVDWDSANNAAVITKGDTTVVVPIGQSFITVDGETVAMDTAALIQNGRTYLPIRAVLEAFDANVEWEDGKVSVTSPSDGEFDNIYIDKNGNLIFELSNGNKINAGSVSKGQDGRDGADGVSVTNAYVDGSGNLMIELSSGRTINAGNIGVGGNMSDLTFADYPIGTKFYLAQPTGSFDVTVYVDDDPYVVKIESIYYELVDKYDINESNAWKYHDGWTQYNPYEVVMHVSGKTDASLHLAKLTLSLCNEEGGLVPFTANISKDGSFTIEDSKSWHKPQSVVFSRLEIEKSTTKEDNLRTSDEGIQFIKDWEGYSSDPYSDDSQLNIGYGTSIVDARKHGFSDTYLSKDDAHDLLIMVLDETETYLDNFLDHNNILVDQYQYDALMSLTYDIGRSWMSLSSKVGKLLINGNYTANEMASAFGLYCHTGNGKNAVIQDHVLTRRIQEAKLYLFGAYNLTDTTERFCRLMYSGNVPPDYQDVGLYLQGEPYQILFDPDPENTGYSGGMYFIGWYTEDDEKITASTIVSDSITVYAKWSWFLEDPELEQPKTPHVHAGPAVGSR